MRNITYKEPQVGDYVRVEYLNDKCHEGIISYIDDEKIEFINTYARFIFPIKENITSLPDEEMSEELIQLAKGIREKVSKLSEPLK
jgi:hypothetical protein